MFDDYRCVRCARDYKWGQLNQTPEGHLFCAECWDKFKNEPKRRCPVDDSEMEKQIVADIILIDKCATCGGTWFDKGELRLVQAKWKEAGWSEAFLVGWFF